MTQWKEGLRNSPVGSIQEEGCTDRDHGRMLWSWWARLGVKGWAIQHRRVHSRMGFEGILVQIRHTGLNRARWTGKEIQHNEQVRAPQVSLIPEDRNTTLEPVTKVSGNKAVTALIWGKEYPVAFLTCTWLFHLHFLPFGPKISYVLVPTLAAIYIRQRKHSAQGLRYFQWCMKIFSFFITFQIGREK